MKDINIISVKFRLLIVGLLSLLYMWPVSGQSNHSASLTDSIILIMQDRNIAGVNVSVVSKDSVLFAGCFGYANVKDQVSVDSSHLFYQGSITKTFTAMAIMTLVNQGKLTLEDELKKVAPELRFKNKWEKESPVLIKHLLEHKTGFDDMHINTFSADPSIERSALERAEVYQNSLESRWEPGLVHSYSNPGYAVLGYIVEKISGVSYQEYMERNVFDPLGLEHTHFASQLDTNVADDIVMGYVSTVDGHRAVDPSRMIGETAGGLLSSLHDMTRFVQFLLNEEVQNSTQWLSNETIDNMSRVHSWFEEENNLELGYGLGIYNADTEIEGVLFKGHSGGLLGFRTHYLYNEDYDLGLTISNNSGKGNSAIISLLLKHFLEDLKIKTEHSTGSQQVLPSAQDWNGTYYPLNERNGLFWFINAPANTINLKVQQDSLKVNYFMEGSQNYHSVGDGAYMHADDYWPTVFLTTTKGAPSLYYYENYYYKVNGIRLFLFKSILLIAICTGLIHICLFVAQLLAWIFKDKGKGYILPTLLIGLPSLLFMASVGMMMMDFSLESMERLGNISAVSFGIFLFTLLMPIASFVSIVYLIKYKSDISSKLLKALYWATCLSGIFLVSYCITNDWFALRLWAF